MSRNIASMILQLHLQSLAVLVIVSVLLQHTSNADKNTKTKYVAVKSNNEPACSLDEPSLTVGSRGRLACSVKCAESTDNCTSFNYKDDTRSCDLYTYESSCFGIVPNCWHYQKADRPTPDLQNLTGIAAPNCSFPFTYYGGLYYKCTTSINETSGCALLNSAVGCLAENRVWKTCISQTEYVAQNVTLPVSIPTQSTIPLPTINGWIIFQQRINDTLQFNRSWADYKNGFGDISQNGNFWLGLDRLNLITTGESGGRGSYKLRLEFQAQQNLKWFSAEYSSFWVENESLGYQVQFSGFSGDAGDGLGWSALTYVSSSGMVFSTYDNDNSPNRNCAASRGGGWWYNACMYVCLNCGYGIRFYWHPLTDLGLSGDFFLTTSRMMIKQV